MGISQALKYLRNRAGLTQRELAEKTGISLSAIISYENGKRTPNSKAMAKLEAYFQVSGDYLLGNVNFEELDNYALKVYEQMKIHSKSFKEFNNCFHFFTFENQAISLESIDVLYSHLINMSNIQSSDGRQNIHPSFSTELSEILSILGMLNNAGREAFISRGKELTELSSYSR